MGEIAGFVFGAVYLAHIVRGVYNIISYLRSSNEGTRTITFGVCVLGTLIAILRTVYCVLLGLSGYGDRILLVVLAVPPLALYAYALSMGFCEWALRKNPQSYGSQSDPREFMGWTLRLFYVDHLCACASLVMIVLVSVMEGEDAENMVVFLSAAAGGLFIVKVCLAYVPFVVSMGAWFNLGAPADPSDSSSKPLTEAVDESDYQTVFPLAWYLLAACWCMVGSLVMFYTRLFDSKLDSDYSSLDTGMLAMDALAMIMLFQLTGGLVSDLQDDEDDSDSDDEEGGNALVKAGMSANWQPKTGRIAMNWAPKTGASSAPSDPAGGSSDTDSSGISGAEGAEEDTDDSDFYIRKPSKPTGAATVATISDEKQPLDAEPESSGFSGVELESGEEEDGDSTVDEKSMGGDGGAGAGTDAAESGTDVATDGDPASSGAEVAEVASDNEESSDEATQTAGATTGLDDEGASTESNGGALADPASASDGEAPPRVPRNWTPSTGLAGKLPASLEFKAGEGTLEVPGFTAGALRQPTTAAEQIAMQEVGGEGHSTGDSDAQTGGGAEQKSEGSGDGGGDGRSGGGVDRNKTGVAALVDPTSRFPASPSSPAARSSTTKPRTAKSKKRESRRNRRVKSLRKRFRESRTAFLSSTPRRRVVKLHFHSAFAKRGVGVLEGVEVVKRKKKKSARKKKSRE